MKLNITPLSQLDPRWKDKKLGTSSSSIGGYGCALVCVTLLANYYTGQNLTPDEMNAKLVAVNGFANGNLMKWEALSTIFPQITFDRRIDCPDSPAPLDIVEAYLDGSKPVIALVDYNPATKELEQHFVLIVGKDAGDYFIADPMCQPGDGVYYLSAKYGQPAKAICGLRLYSGPVPQEKPPESPTEAQNADLEQVKKTLITLSGTLEQTTDEIVNVKRRLDEQQKSLDILNADRDILENIQAQLTALKTSVDLNTTSNTSLQNQVNQNHRELQDDVASLESRLSKLEQPITTTSEGELVKTILNIGKVSIGWWKRR